MTRDTLIIRRDDIAGILGAAGVDRVMDDTIEGVTRALRDFDPAVTEVRPRVGFAYDLPRPGVIEWMPLMQRHDGVLIKVVAENPDNPARHGLPTIVSTISSYDLATGHLIALADGVVPTAIRTGAASAVASRVLAHPGSETVGLVGCGAQAVTQLHALSRVFRLRRVLIHDVDPATAATFIRRTAFLGLDVRPAPLEVVERESDVLCTATTTPATMSPVVRGEELREWVHVNAVGADMPGKVELPVTLLRRSLVCADFAAQALVEGECQQLRPEEVGPSLAEVVKDEAAYAVWQARSTIFDSTGFALEDKVILDILVAWATRLGLGERVAIESLADDAKDPYGVVAAAVSGAGSRTAGGRGGA